MDPTIFSPIVNSPETVPTSRVLVSEFQVLTLAVVPLEDPVTISLKENVPEPELSGLPITSVGATEYPTPVFER